MKQTIITILVLLAIAVGIFYLSNKNSVPESVLGDDTAMGREQRPVAEVTEKVPFSEVDGEIPPQQGERQAPDVTSAAEVTERVPLSEVDGEIPPQQGERQAPDFTSAAEALGVSETELMEALGEPGMGAPDFASVADTLGVTEDELIEALGVTEGGAPQGGRGGQGGQPPMQG